MRNRANQRDPFAGQTTAVTLLDQAAVELYYAYSKVDEAHRQTVRRAAITIKPRLKRSAEDLFVIGKELQATKALLPHGEYSNWLAAEFGLSERMAQRFVSVYERLGFKSDIMSVLPPTTLYLLSAEDWLALYHNDELKRVREEMVRLKARLAGAVSKEGSL